MVLCCTLVTAAPKAICETQTGDAAAAENASISWAALCSAALNNFVAIESSNKRYYRLRTTIGVLMGPIFGDPELLDQLMADRNVCVISIIHGKDVSTILLS